MHKLRKSVRNIIHDILFINNNSEYNKPKYINRDIAIKKPTFKWFDPDELLMDDHYKTKPPLLSDFIEDVSIKDLSEPLNYAFIDSNKYWGNDPDMDYSINHIRKAKPQEVRHLRYNQYPIVFNSFSFNKNEMHTCGIETMFFYFQNENDYTNEADPFYKKYGKLIGCWKHVDRFGNYGNIERGGALECCLLRMLQATAYQFHSYFLWNVDIGYPGKPKLRLYVDHDDIKLMFKDRDIREGKNRKDALLNWVMSHQRRKPVKHEYTTVKKHMRGMYPFIWDGLECTIVPSKEDVKKQIENVQSEKTAEIVYLLEEAAAA